MLILFPSVGTETGRGVGDFKSQDTHRPDYIVWNDSICTNRHEAAIPCLTECNGNTVSGFYKLIQYNL